MTVCDYCGGNLTDPGSGVSPDGVRRGRGVDPCLGRLPGVLSACCGHGTNTPYPPYLWLDDGTKFSQAAAIAMMRELGGNPPPGDYPSMPVPGILSDVSRSRA